jgi:hypothetical protein
MSGPYLRTARLTVQATAEIQNRWSHSINTRLDTDRFLATNDSRQGKKTGSPVPCSQYLERDPSRSSQPCRSALWHKRDGCVWHSHRYLAICVVHLGTQMN